MKIKKKKRYLKNYPKNKKEDYHLFRKEFLFNIPSALNALRIILTFVVIYMIISEKNIIATIIVFLVAGITDWFDGRIARKYKLVNPFGAKADMFADRILWIGVSLTIFLFYGAKGNLGEIRLIQLIFIMSREIIAFPFVFVALIFGKKIFPDARYIAKVTTFIQGGAIPALILSIFYPIWMYISIPLSLIILITGIISGIRYTQDLKRLNGL